MRIGVRRTISRSDRFISTTTRCCASRSSSRTSSRVCSDNGYPWLIHRLTYRRTNHRNLHVRGYKEEGTTTTPFDMVVLNNLDRFHLVTDVIERVPQLERVGAHAKQAMRDKLIEHKHYIARHGDDLPDVRDWRWSY